MIWGRQDPHIPREGRQLIYNALSDANIHFQWHEFNAAHAFIRDEGPRYDPAMAQLSYQITLELFKRKLGEGDHLQEQPDASAAQRGTKYWNAVIPGQAVRLPEIRLFYDHEGGDTFSPFLQWGVLYLCSHQFKPFCIIA